MTLVKSSATSLLMPVLVKSGLPESQALSMLARAIQFEKDVLRNHFKGSVPSVPPLWKNDFEGWLLPLHREEPVQPHQETKPSKKSIIETMITLDYRSSAWGIERIVLDGIQNHLPNDSRGTEVHVLLKQTGKWVDLKEADPMKGTEAVVFLDDGRGYASSLLSILYSSKGENDWTGGQFGEGLKMIAAAALREGVELQYQSRNWTAKPFTKDETVGEHDVKKLCFEITEYVHSVTGSRTVFRNPPKKLLDEIFRLPENQLALNHNYRTLYRDQELSDRGPRNVRPASKGRHDQMYSYRDELKVVSIPTGELDSATSEVTKDFEFLAKRLEGMKIKKERLDHPLRPKKEILFYARGRQRSRIIELHGVFGDAKFLYIMGEKKHAIKAVYSYDLAIREISPDRREVAEDKKLDEIEGLLQKCDNEEVLLTILTMAHQKPHGHYAEFNALNQHRKSFGVIGTSTFIRDLDEGRANHHSPWVRAFFKLFGANAILGSDSDINANKDAQILGLNPVTLNRSVADHLRKLGIPDALNMRQEKDYRFISPEELTESERAIMSLADEVNEILIGGKKAVPLRIYSGLFLRGGTEVESDRGVQIRRRDGSKMIGIKRTCLQDEDEFLHWYIHELGHYVTDKGDYDRDFTDFFVKALAKMTKHRMKNRNS